MLYLNQRNFYDVPYNHNVDFGGAPEERRNVGTSGCGICCMSMVVNHLTGRDFPVKDCVRLAESCGANRYTGTSLRVLGPEAAEIFGLEMSTADDAESLIRHLGEGGEAVAHVGGDTPERAGLFSHKGHYVVVVSVSDDGKACILDPSLEPGKFDEEGRRGKVEINEPFVCCSLDELMMDIRNHQPGFYLFRKNKRVKT